MKLSVLGPLFLGVSVLLPFQSLWAQCPADEAKLFDESYVKKMEHQHEKVSSYDTTIEIKAEMNQKDKADYSVDRHYLQKAENPDEVQGITYSEIRSSQYGSIEKFPGHLKDFAKGIFADEKYVNDWNNWDAVQISRKNFKIECVAVDEKSPDYPGKRVYEYSVTPLVPGVRGQFTGQLWLDGSSGFPLEIHKGLPTVPPKHVNNMEFTQKYIQEGDYVFPSETKVEIHAIFWNNGDATLKYTPPANLQVNADSPSSTSDSQK